MRNDIAKYTETAIFVDSEKAFDTFQHLLFLEKNEKSSLERSHLTMRNVFQVIDGKKYPKHRIPLKKNQK